MLKTKRRLLASTAFSVAVTILLLGYSAYAWMSMSREVRATGMDMTLTAPTNLEISSTGNTDDYHSFVTVQLNEAVAKLTENDAVPFDAAANTFSLLPASSFEGLSMWKTDMAVLTSGAAVCADNEFQNVDTGRVRYHADTDTFEGYYLDIPLWLRTSSEMPIDVVLLENGMHVEVKSGSDEVAKVVRVAFLNDTATALSVADNADFSDSLVCAGNGANAARGVVTAGSGGYSAVVPAKYFNDTPQHTANTVLCRLGGIETTGGVTYHPVQITVRIWIEGQDTACVASIGQSRFSIEIGFCAKEDS